jgi:hypothetical protein
MQGKRNTPESFWALVDKSAGPDGCWLWTGYKTPDGYGCSSFENQLYQAHRLAWLFTFGPIPDGLCVLHDCPGGDRRDCLNPAHLWLGTNAANTADRVRKGCSATGDRHGSRTHPERVARGDRHSSKTHPERVARGEKQGNSKLTWDKVREIRVRFTNGDVTKRGLAREYNVSRRSIGFILSYKTWLE